PNVPSRAGKQALQVRELVWDKLAQQLPANTRLVYVASDGALTQMPWAALPGSGQDTILLEQYAFAVVPHGQFLLRQLTSKAQHAGGGLLLAGAVDYATSDQLLVQLPNAQDNLRSPPLPKQGLIWPALPGTKRELTHIAKLAKGQLPTEALTGTQASTE